jgi:DNA modification methylase
MSQLTLPLFAAPDLGDRDPLPLRELLEADLEFHSRSSTHGSHDFHAFPAKFPPQLPRHFIEGLTRPGEVVLDPMMGSGTTILEALAVGRRAVGLDIDPLALRLCRVKTTSVSVETVARLGYKVAQGAEFDLHHRRSQLENEIVRRFNEKTRQFIDYWFAFETQLELVALIRHIERIPDSDIREFLELAFSAIVITKSGGVSLARDLAHTRPHRVVKVPRLAIPEFRKRLQRNMRGLAAVPIVPRQVYLQFGNAESMPLANGSVDLIVTSPPYAANAIDYMRAHKFSLVWLGHSIDDLSALRARYIGGESTVGQDLLPLPLRSLEMVQRITHIDRKKGLALHRYYSEMTRVLTGAFRVLKPRGAAVFVVGSSTMRGLDTQTHICLGEIGHSIGFELDGIARRSLDRDRRMMPARARGARQSQIEERMHEEYVIGFVKPAS